MPQRSVLPIFLSILALLATPWLNPPLRAQTVPGGSVTGHVRGPGDVSVPGATVVLINKETGQRKMTWTDEAGNYTLANLPPGTYRLEVSLVGFRSDVREPVPVAAERPLKVNVALRMAVGEEPGVASASGEGPRGANRAASEASIPQVSGERLSSAAMEAGETGGDQATEDNLRFTESSSMTAVAASGEAQPSVSDLQASAANSFLLSGSVGRAPTPEGDERRRGRGRFREFGGMRGGQSAPGFGGGGFGGPGGFFGGRGGRRGPQINRVRGNFFERYSNSALNARPYPLNVAESPQIPSYREQFGVGLGGPLVIPRVYNGRDKTSFFVNYNLSRSRQPFDSFATVPTLLERAGDFSETVIPAGALAGTTPIVYDPRPNPSGVLQPFAENRIPSELLDPAALGLLGFIPAQNLPGSVQNFHLQQALPSSSDRVTARLGHQITAQDSLNAVYFLNSSRSDAVSSFPALTRHTSARSQNVNLSETHTFGPRVVNTLLLNFSRQRTSTLNPFAFTRDVAGELGIQGVSDDPRDWGLPIISLTNFTGLNDVIPSLVRNQTLRAVDFVMLNSGRHNFRFGGELRRVQLNTLTNPDARGTFTFTGFTTSSFTPDGFPVPGTGFDFADFLLGLPQATSVRFGTSSNYLRSWVLSGFLQDDWRMSSHLTFNLGFRYEYFQPITEKYGHLSNLAVGPEFSSVDVVTGLAPAGLPASLIRGDANNWAPRLGLAYRPWNRRRIVLRAGYGIFYDGSIYQRLVPNLTNQPPFAQASTLVTSPERVLTLAQGFPEIDPRIARNTYAVDPNFRTPYGQTWNFSIDDELARDVILSVGYVGTKGTKLDLMLGPNRALSPTPLATQDTLALREALQFTYETSGAASIYHGLQLDVRRQFHSGFSLNATYTFSKSIDNAASLGGAGRTVAQDFLNLRAERGLSVFDVRHRLRVRHTYELPFGERKRFLNRSGLLRGILGDWQLSGSATLQTGTPFTARVLGNQSGSGGTGAYFSLRADATGEPVSLPSGQRTTQRYFNTGAFTLPAAGELGNAGRNTVPGPRLIDFDMSLGRFFTLSREKNVRADFRVEAQNVFNTPSFSGLATVVDATDFGRVTSVRAMRSLTISMRMRF